MAFSICTYALLICLLYTAVLSEPVCSKFAYEEQLLEKMVRLKFNVEQMEKEIKNTNSLVQDALHQLKQNWETVVKDYEDMKTETKNVVDENINKITTEIKVINKEKEGLNESIDDKIVKLTEKVSVPNIAFKARAPLHINQVENQVIVLTKKFVDTGKTYDNATGIFTAPVDGTYLLTCQLCTYLGKQLTFGIYVGDTRHTLGRFYQKDASICFNIETTATMMTGQTASVKSWSLASGNELLESDNEYWNVFSGTLIHKRSLT